MQLSTVEKVGPIEVGSIGVLAGLTISEYSEELIVSNKGVQNRDLLMAYSSLTARVGNRDKFRQCALYTVDAFGNDGNILYQVLSHAIEAYNSNTLGDKRDKYFILDTYQSSFGLEYTSKLLDRLKENGVAFT